MDKSMRWSFILLFISCLSCQEDPNLKNVCVSPVGSAKISIPVAPLNGYFSDYNIICFGDKHNACFVLESSPTATIIWAVDYTTSFPGSTIGKLSDSGKVRCVGDAIVDPASNYVYQVAASIHHAYVVELPDKTHGRIFVDSWDVGSTGAVKTINLIWQYPF